MRGGVAHWDEVTPRERVLSDIAASWTDLGSASGSVDVGLELIRIMPGKRSTPVHVHGAEEEIFYVVSGSGMLWQSGETCRVGPGDCIVHLPCAARTRCGPAPRAWTVLAFGTRVPIELCYLPRAEHSWAGPTVLPSPPRFDLFPLDDAVPLPVPRAGRAAAQRGRHGRGRGHRPRDDGRDAPRPGRGGRLAPHRHQAHHRRAGPALRSARTATRPRRSCSSCSRATAPSCWATSELPVRPGSVVSRPAGTGVAHTFRGGAGGITLLAYGTREPNDICFYPRSGKIAFWRASA